jgi:hypothetical protein
MGVLQEKIRAHGEQEAQRLIREGLAAAGLGGGMIPSRLYRNEFGPPKNALTFVVLRDWTEGLPALISR